tara:strand:- start:138 stop:326 length:189 start_codon:yes stop_codon:yes gene_type:complete
MKELFILVGGMALGLILILVIVLSTFEMLNKLTKGYTDSPIFVVPITVFYILLICTIGYFLS